MRSYLIVKKERTEKLLKDFRNALFDCDLRDLGFSVTPFTWSNGREGDGLICERLYKYVENLAWCSLFLRAKVYHGSMSYSDHLPLILFTEGEVQNLHQGPKSFRYKAMWVRHEGVLRSLRVRVIGDVCLLPRPFWRKFKSTESD